MDEKYNDGERRQFSSQFHWLSQILMTSAHHVHILGQRRIFFFFVFSVELFATFFLIFFCLRTNSEVVWRCSKSWRLWLQCTTNKMNGRRQNVVVAAKFKQNFYLFSTHNNNNTQRATGYYYRFFFLRFLCLICLVKTFCLITLDKEILLHTSLAHLIISIHAVWFVICCVP